MKTFIVRLYRNGGEDGGTPIGVVEFVGGTYMRPFKDIEELWDILTGQELEKWA